MALDRLGAVHEVSTEWERVLWGDAATLSSWQRRLRPLIRLAYALGRDLVSGLLTLQAMSLVYTTLLSLVPLLAVSFSVLKGFGVHNQLEPMLLQILSPLGSGAQDIAKQLIVFVDNTNVGVLGAMGLALLLYSVVSLISKIEQVFNISWHIDRPRPLGERFSRYLSVLLVGPVLLFSAVATSTSLSTNALLQRLVDIEPLGFVLDIAEGLLPYLLITLAFTFVYSFVPNTRVRVIPALAGALVAGALWLTAGGLFARFMAGSTRYAAIYSGLAIPILFMIWIYIAWLIVLIGAKISFYVQYPEYLASRDGDLRLSNRLRERVALQVMQRIIERYFAGGPGVTAEALSHELGVPLVNLRWLVDMLRAGGFVVHTATEPQQLVPGLAPEQMPVRDLLRHVRRFGENKAAPPGEAEQAVVANIEQRLQQGMDDALAGMTLKDLATTPAGLGETTTQKQP